MAKLVFTRGFRGTCTNNLFFAKGMAIDTDAFDLSDDQVDEIVNVHNAATVKAKPAAKRTPNTTKAKGK